MRKTMFCIAAIAIISFADLLPFSGTDVGKLNPVEVLIVADTDDGISVETDTGLQGTGEAVGNAIENLKLTSAGEIFLDTANYVLISDDSVQLLDELYNYLRPACQVYAFTGSGKWRNIAKYLESHPSEVTLLGYRQGKSNIQRLLVSGEDYKIDRS